MRAYLGLAVRAEQAQYVAARQHQAGQGDEAVRLQRCNELRVVREPGSLLRRPGGGVDKGGVRRQPGSRVS